MNATVLDRPNTAQPEHTLPTRESDLDGSAAVSQRAHVRCDGPFGTDIHMFTDIDPQSPSFGGTFCLRTPFDTDDILRELAAQRARFSSAS